MRLALKNKQRLQYALYKGKEDIPQTDSNNDVIYDETGEPMRSGSKKPTFGRPVDFFANIAFAGGEAEAEAYGVSIGDYDSKIVVPRGSLPITETSIIFKDSKPKYRSDGSLDDKSADFRVRKVQPSLNYTVYLLKRIEK